ncbi:MAG TPA: mechanosensitive ion channel family protein [Pilimelia sp.]|nr:mechanosensitive ion channel family protein [Pilimelia sp.]
MTPLDDVTQWFRGSGLEIVLLVLGAVLLGRFVSWMRDRVRVRIQAEERESPGEIVRSEGSKHRQAVTEIAAWVAVVLIWAVTAAMVVNRLGIPFASLVAPLAAGGVALALGAQRVVSDLLSGAFIIAERQYGVGDLVQIAATPQTDGATGTVEELTLRITRLRTAGGERVIIPNSQIVQVANLSSDWARAVVDVPLPIGTDISSATDLLRQVCEEAYEDEGLRALLLDTPTVMGVESLDESTVQIRVVARTLPGKQFDVARRLRIRMAVALQSHGIRATASESAAPPVSAT